jgi:hypothetical protein
LETTTTPIRFRMQVCERCGRETVQAFRSESDEFRICSGCEPAAFERAAFEAGRQELLR